MDTLSRGETGKITGKTVSKDTDNQEVLSTDNSQSRWKWKTNTTSKWFCKCSNTTQLAIAIATIMVFVVVILVFTSTVQNNTNEIVSFVNDSNPLTYNRTKL